MLQRLMVLACLATVTLLATACSSDDDPNPGEPFIGTWGTTTGKQTVSGCVFQSAQENMAITYTVVKGDGADVTITSSADGDCTLKANVVGPRATLIEDQKCVRTGDKYKDSYRFATTSVIDMSNAAATTIKLEATFDRATLDGADTGYSCGFTEEAPITKR